MKCSINGKTYDYYKGYQDNEELRSSLNILAQKSFGGLNFDKWYFQGFWNDKCIPYSLFDGHICVANVFASSFQVILSGEEKLYIQLGTVMTHSDYRKNGLSRFLIQAIIEERHDACDAVYLYANDRVLDFYPRFGFIEEQEYQYGKPISNKCGEMRKLHIENETDKSLLLEKCRYANPFSAVQMPNSIEFIMFHCLMFQKDNLYYLPEYDAVVIAEQNNEKLICFDIFCKTADNFDDMLSIVAGQNCKQVVLGFTPLEKCGCKAALLQEKDTHLFVLQDKENVFRNNKLMLPMLCHT